MSVSNVNNNPLAAALRGAGRPLSNGVQPGAAQPGAVRPNGVAAPAALKPQQPLAAAQPSLPAEAPAGTDPALWSVLTGEERAFFAKAAASGPLTYSRISAGVNALQGNPVPAAGARIGGRLDVRA
ncbi:MAG: hypothetical protein ACXW05_02810 [Gemmatirosa sp.]